jgi:hypothetical protein
MPSVRGGTVFALMGDSGSGDRPRQAVAQAMLTYFNTARHFPFVLMLGDTSSVYLVIDLVIDLIIDSIDLDNRMLR